MEFRFDVNKFLPKRINKITHTLIPEGFRGEERRDYNDCQRLMTRILDDMGEASAKAQGLNKTITSAIKLRDTDHVIYLMIDKNGNGGLGSVVGLLKTGSKTLFMFDENGLHYQVKPRCILDFYIHESRQRMGLGNELYQFMLNEENLKPIKLAIDRPSEKFLAFLKKHYGLQTVIPQNNKFVVFQGFFDDELDDSKTGKFSSPYTAANVVEYKTPPPSANNNNVNRKINSIHNNVNGTGTPVSQNSFGRYAAPRPPCSMANIIHNTSRAEKAVERTAGSATSTPKRERPGTLSLHSDEEILNQANEIENAVEAYVNESFKSERNDFEEEQNEEVTSLTTEAPEVIDAPCESNDNYCDKIDDDVKSVSSNTTQDALEKTGHLDLKFYHSPLW